MPELQLPAVPELLGNAVIVQKDVWDTLVKYIRSMQTFVNEQARSLTACKARIEKLESNTATLAKALLGGMYDET